MIVVREQGTVVFDFLFRLRRSGYQALRVFCFQYPCTRWDAKFQWCNTQPRAHTDLANTDSLSSMAQWPREYLLMLVSQDHAKQAGVKLSRSKQTARLRFCKIARWVDLTVFLVGYDYTLFTLYEHMSFGHACHEWSFYNGRWASSAFSWILWVPPRYSHLTTGL